MSHIEIIQSRNHTYSQIESDALIPHGDDVSDDTEIEERRVYPILCYRKETQ